MFKKCLLAGIFLFLVFSVKNVLAQENRGDFVIDNFQVDILVNQNSIIEVSEMIEVNFSEKRHGIFRDIPVEYKNDKGFDFNLKLRNISVRDQQGNPYQFQVSDQGSNKRIKIGNPNLEIVGKQIYDIKYEIKKGIRYFEDHDELYWNPIGTGWPTLIEQASSQVRFEEGVNYVENSSYCYTGFFGSEESDCSIEENQNKVLFTTNNQLSPNEGMTIVLSFPKGEIYQPSYWENTGLFIVDNWGFLIPIVVFVVMFIVWFFKGKDKPFKKTLIAQYEVPDNLSPGELGYLMKEKYNGRFLAGDIINLAIKGYLKIEEIEKKNTSKAFFLKISFIKKIKTIWLVIFLLIAFFLDLGLFVVFLVLFVLMKTFGLQKFESKEFQFKKLKNWDKAKDLSIYEKKILEGIFESRNIGSKVKLNDRKDFYKTKKEIDQKIKKQIEKKSYFSKNNWNNKLRYIVTGFIFMFVVIFFGALIEGLDVVLGGVFSFFIMLIFSFIMSKKTSKGAEAYWKVQGFKHYIDIAENDRAKFYAKENMFESILPYAIVFGNVDKWAKAFDGIIKESPDWYSGTGTFSAIAFSQSLSSGLVTSSNLASASPSSSGSGGSGSSGGGGGGGGGGSW